MPGLVVIEAEVLTVMHVLRCTIDPDALNWLDISIKRHVETTCPSAENHVIRGNYCRGITINAVHSSMSVSVSSMCISTPPDVLFPRPGPPC